jgi:tetratricopeptide (TPR) repeat protein
MAWTWTLALAVLAVQPPPDPLRAAIAELDADRPARAVELLTPLAAARPDDVAVHFHLGLAYSLAGDDGSAAAAFRKCLALRPELYEARLNLGQILARDGKGQEALEVLEPAILQKPADAKPVYLAGRALAAQAKPAEAAAAYEKALQLGWKDQDLKLELAQMYESLGQTAKAAAYYAEFPGNPAARERLGLIQLNSGDAGAAIATFEALRASAPTPAVLYALATAYLRDKKPDKAAAVAAEVVQREPASVEMRLFYGRLLRDEKKYQDAAVQFEQGLARRPGSLELWNEMAGMLILLKRHETALAALDKIRSLGGETPSHVYFRAISYDALNRPKEALEAYQRFLSLSQDKFPDEEFKARQRARILEKAVNR